MAQIKFGLVVTDVRGKAGGVVFSKGRSGNILRVKSSAIKPSTAPQSFQKSIVKDASVYYKNSLTQAERLLWDADAQQHPRLDVFGSPITMSGSQKFLLQNNLRRIAWFYYPNDPDFEGQPWVRTPPVPYDLDIEMPIPLSFQLDIISSFGQTIKVTVDKVFHIDEVWPIFRMTNMLQSGVNNFKDKLRIISVWPSQAGLFKNFRDEAQFVKLYGPPFIGQTYGIQMGLHHVKTGAFRWGPLRKIQAIE